MYSVVIPAYNAEDYIAEAVVSAAWQIFKPLEIICINDGSSDKTLDILKRLEKEISLVRVISQDNQGACVARNRGLQEAKSDWIQFLDADDIILPNKVSNQMELIKESYAKGINVDIVVSPYYKKTKNNFTFFPVERVNPYIGLVMHKMGITSANLWSKHAILKAGGWNHEMKSSQEYELMFRMIKQGASVAYSFESNTIIRDTHNSISKGSYIFDNSIRLRSSIINEFRQSSDYNEEDEYLMLNSIFSWIRGYSDIEPDKAFSIYNQIMPPGFVPLSSKRITSKYVLIFRILGFEKTERLRQYLKNFKN